MGRARAAAPAIRRAPTRSARRGQSRDRRGWIPGPTEAARRLRGGSPCWGASSERDHIDAAALAIDVLLYNRLIFPTPADWDIERWREEGWEPELQRERMALLGQDIAMPRQWNVPVMEVYADLLRGLRRDAQDIAAEGVQAAFRMTRRASCRGSGPRCRRTRTCDRSPPVAVPRSSRAAWPRGIATSCARGPRYCSARASWRPPASRWTRSNRAIALARTPRFRDSRRAFYDWQDTAVSRIASGDLTAAAAAREMIDRVAAYNELVERAGGARRSKLVYTVAALAAE